MLRQDNPDQYWSEYYEKGGDFLSLTSQEVKRLLSYVPKSASKTALDLGCGTGQLTRELYHNGYHVVGIEASKTAIKIARSLSVISEKDLFYEHRDFDAKGLSGLPFVPYGIITCQSVYPFIKNKQKLFTEVKRVLTPEGAFIVINTLKSKMPAEKQKIAVDPKEVMEALQQTFKVEYYEDGPLGVFVCLKKGS